MGGVKSGRLGFGDEVEWEAVHLGIRWRMRVRITAFEPPSFIRDELVTGPFVRYRHDHRFEAIGAESTTKWDVIELAAPLGILGWIVERLVLRKYMMRLVQERNQALIDLLGDEVV